MIYLDMLIVKKVNGSITDYIFDILSFKKRNFYRIESIFLFLL